MTCQTLNDRTILPEPNSSASLSLTLLSTYKLHISQCGGQRGHGYHVKGSDTLFPIFQAICFHPQYVGYPGQVLSAPHLLDLCHSGTKTAGFTAALESISRTTTCSGYYILLGIQKKKKGSSTLFLAPSTVCVIYKVQVLDENQNQDSPFNSGMS